MSRIPMSKGRIPRKEFNSSASAGTFSVVVVIAIIFGVIICLSSLFPDADPSV